MHHARAQNLQPITTLAQFAGFAAPADIHFHGRFREGEIGSAEPHRQIGNAEKGAQEINQTALQMAKMNVPINHQAFYLMKHRRMRRIMIRAIGAARHNHANGRRFSQHCADLHRRCMGAQHWAPTIHRRHVKRIMILPRWMVVWDIERAEIMPIAFDIGAFRHFEAHGAEQRG